MTFFQYAAMTGTQPWERFITDFVYIFYISVPEFSCMKIYHAMKKRKDIRVKFFVYGDNFFLIFYFKVQGRIGRQLIFQVTELGILKGYGSCLSLFFAFVPIQFSGK